jgi:DNA-directed RNA polymerase specialized sigma24 family protein
VDTGSEIVSLRQNAQALSNPRRSPVSTRPAETGGQVCEMSQSTNWSIDQDSFDQLLSWLDPDPEMAGQKYEFIRRKLIRLFLGKRCPFAEDLADETFNRVARRLSQIRQYYVGNPLNYFVGVARKIYLEYMRRLSAQKLPSFPAADEDMNELFGQLEDCISQLPREDRDMILTYYREDGRKKIDLRKRLAEEFGIPVNVLRLRVHRIVSRLRKQAGDFNGTFL